MKSIDPAGAGLKALLVAVRIPEDAFAGAKILENAFCSDLQLFFVAGVFSRREQCSGALRKIGLEQEDVRHGESLGSCDDPQHGGSC